MFCQTECYKLIVACSRFDFKVGLSDGKLKALELHGNQYNHIHNG